jgi:hypothetical protein
MIEGSMDEAKITGIAGWSFGLLGTVMLGPTVVILKRKLLVRS